jgi:hypothetical protein
MTTTDVTLHAIVAELKAIREALEQIARNQRTVIVQPVPVPAPIITVPVPAVPQPTPTIPWCKSPEIICTGTGANPL